MRLKVTRSKNSASLYVIRSVYNRETKSSTTVIVEKLGTEKALREKLGGGDPYEWAKKHIMDLNKKEKEQRRQVLVPYRQPFRIRDSGGNYLNGGCLFFRQIYYSLGLDRICAFIADKYRFDYDLNNILSVLLYSVLIFPFSGPHTPGGPKKFLGQPDFEERNVLSALDALGRESAYIQSELYRKSRALSGRKESILIFCRRGPSNGARGKRGLTSGDPCEIRFLMDRDGIPLAFSDRGTDKESRGTVTFLERQIMEDVAPGRLIVCADAGFFPGDMTHFRGIEDLCLISVQPAEKLRDDLRKWCFKPTGWRSAADKINRESAFYKELIVDEGGLKRKLVAAFPAGKVTCGTFQSSMLDEACYGSLYTAFMNPDDDPKPMVKIACELPEIKSCLELIVSNLKAWEDTQARFVICFLSLVLLRYLGKKVGHGYTCEEMMTALRDMNFLSVYGEGYVPVYIRTDLTDALHEAFGFRTDYKIMSKKQMKKVFRYTEEQKSL